MSRMQSPAGEQSPGPVVARRATVGGNVPPALVCAAGPQPALEPPGPQQGEKGLAECRCAGGVWKVVENLPSVAGSVCRKGDPW